jgi:hypothetical protein
MFEMSEGKRTSRRRLKTTLVFFISYSQIWCFRGFIPNILKINNFNYYKRKEALKMFRGNRKKIQYWRMMNIFFYVTSVKDEISLKMSNLTTYTKSTNENKIVEYNDDVEESIVIAARITGLNLTPLFALFVFLLCRLRVVRSQPTPQGQPWPEI